MLKVEKMWIQGWKIDKFQWLLNFMWSFLNWIGVPLVVWSFCHSQQINLPLDANTYFAVFAVFFIKSICRNFVHPPMCKMVPKETVEASKETTT